MIIATTFTVAWLPFQLNLIVIAYGNRAHALFINSTLQALAFANSCVNPIVYALMWRPFRNSLVQVRLIYLRPCLQNRGRSKESRRVRTTLPPSETFFK